MTEDARSYWDAQAATFDDEPDHGLTDPAVAAAWDELLARVIGPPPGRVADLGAGTGSLALLLARRGHAVTGVDVSLAMVRQARRKAAYQRVDVGFLVGDAAAPPLMPGSFDSVVVRHLLWAMPDPAAAIDEWARLLKPTGRLVLIEGYWGTGAGLRAQTVMRLVEEKLSGASLTRLSDEAYWGRPISDERYLITADR